MVSYRIISLACWLTGWQTGPSGWTTSCYLITRKTNCIFNLLQNKATKHLRITGWLEVTSRCEVWLEAYLHHSLRHIASQLTSMDQKDETETRNSIKSSESWHFKFYSDLSVALSKMCFCCMLVSWSGNGSRELEWTTHFDSLGLKPLSTNDPERLKSSFKVFMFWKNRSLLQILAQTCSGHRRNGDPFTINSF